MTHLFSTYVYSDAIYYIWMPIWVTRWTLHAFVDLVLLWPFRALNKMIRHESSAALEFVMGFTAMAFGICLAWGRGTAAIHRVLVDLAPVQTWCGLLILVGIAQMWCAANGTAPARAQVNAIGCVMWMMLGGLLNMRYGLVGNHGMLAGAAFGCLLAVIILIERYRHGPTDPAAQ